MVGITQAFTNTPTPTTGPSVAVKVPEGALVAVHAQAQISQEGGGGADRASVHLYEPTVAASAPQIMSSSSDTPQFRYTIPAPGEADGAQSQVRSGWLVLSNVPAGRRVFSLRYATDGGTGSFQDRELNVMVIR